MDSCPGHVVTVRESLKSSRFETPHKDCTIECSYGDFYSPADAGGNSSEGSVTPDTLGSGVRPERGPACPALCTRLACPQDEPEASFTDRRVTPSSTSRRRRPSPWLPTAILAPEPPDLQPVCNGSPCLVASVSWTG